MKSPTIPHDFIIPDLLLLSDWFTHVYKLLKNLYGLKDTDRTWNNHLKKGLLKRGWVQSDIDGCLFTKPEVLLILYVDKACFISPERQRIDTEIKLLQKDYDLTNDGNLKDYLGNRFDRQKDGTITLTQPCMIDRVFKIVGLDQE